MGDLDEDGRWMGSGSLGVGVDGCVGVREEQRVWCVERVRMGGDDGARNNKGTNEGSTLYSIWSDREKRKKKKKRERKERKNRRNKGKGQKQKKIKNNTPVDLDQD